MKNMIETKRLKMYAATKEQMKKFIAEQSVDVLKEAYAEMLKGRYIFAINSIDIS